MSSCENGTIRDNVGFIGGGMMAEAIMKGILNENVILAKQIIVSEPNKERQQYLLKELSVEIANGADPLLQKASVVFIAVKPNIVPFILPTIQKYEEDSRKSNHTSDTLFVSICAGVTIETLSEGNKERKVIRVMPNQPCLVGAAASAVSFSASCSDDDKKKINILLSACGVVEQLPESLLDSVTGLSGSGPAFVFMMIEAMADAGVKNGLPRPVARQLAAQTVYGSAKMVLNEPGVHPAEFRNRVESPGGTTIAGTSSLEKNNFRSAVIDAVTAAKERAIELGKR